MLRIKRVREEDDGRGGWVLELRAGDELPICMISLKAVSNRRATCAWWIVCTVYVMRFSSDRSELSWISIYVGPLRLSGDVQYSMRKEYTIA